MKKTILIPVLFFCTQLFGNVINNDALDKCVTIAYDNSGAYLKFKIIQNKNDSAYYFLISNYYENNVFDTLKIDFSQGEYIHEQEYGYGNVSQNWAKYKLKTMQLDGTGQEELIIEIDYRIEYGHGMMYYSGDANYLQIWNLDTRSRMFYAQTNDFVYGSVPVTDEEIDEITGDTTYVKNACIYECKYEYKIYFQEEKEETYNILIELNEIYCKDGDDCGREYDTPLCHTSNLEEGLYTLKNGVYTKKENDSP